MFTPPGETVSEQKKCRISGKDFVVTDKDVALLEKLTPTIDGKRFDLPTPSCHPDIRMSRRLNYRNEMSLYSRKCSLTDKPIISVYSPDKDYVVYNQASWWSDAWDRFDHGFVHDDSRSFAAQFDEMLHRIPLLGSTVVASENCEYNNDSGESKDLYLCYRTHYCEQCSYCYRANKSQNCSDCYQVKVSSYLYECFQCEECHRGIFLFNCIFCSDSSFLWNCQKCKDCFMCWDLTDKQYCIMNEQYSKEEYQQKVAEYEKWTDQKLSQAKQFFFAQIKKVKTDTVAQFESENCVGDDLIRCQDCMGVFMMKDCIGSRYAWDNLSFTECMDNYSAKGSELCYETTATKGSYMTHFTVRVKECSECMYCMFCFNCQNCFGCYGLQGKSFCIFNKQYSQQEYYQEVSRIIGHMQLTGEWGEFFPHELSPFCYNETVAQDYFPIDQTVANERGWKWHQEPKSEFTGQAYQPLDILQYHEETVGANEARKNIDACLAGTLVCEITGKPYRITRQELVFYISNKISLPRRCPDQRHQDRVQFRRDRDLERLTD